jgi:hypothetical protein
VCGSAHSSVRAVRAVVYGIALGSSVRQCAQQYAAVRQRGSVHNVRQCVSAHGSVRQCVAVSV